METEIRSHEQIFFTGTPCSSSSSSSSSNFISNKYMKANIYNITQLHWW